MSPRPLAAAAAAVQARSWGALAEILAALHLREDQTTVAAIMQAHPEAADVLHPGFVWIPPGLSRVGERTVGSARPLLVQRRPVTHLQWRAETSSLKRWLGHMLEPVTWRDDAASVEGILWPDAVKLCQQWSAREGVAGAYVLSEEGITNPFLGEATHDIRWRSLSADGYRLPSESEWLYAATGDGSGFDPEQVTLVRVLPDARTQGPSDHFHLSRGFPHAVCGGSPPSGFGLLDRYGGVLEWCWDVVSDYWQPIPIPEDPFTVTGSLYEPDPLVRTIKAQWDCLHVCAGGARFLSRSECGPEKRRASGADFNYPVGLRMVRNAVLPGDTQPAIALAILARAAAMLLAEVERLTIAAEQLREHPEAFSPPVPDGPPHFGSIWADPEQVVPRQAHIARLEAAAEQRTTQWEAVTEAASSQP